MRPPSDRAFSASNDSLFNAIDFFAPRQTNKNKRHLHLPDGHLPPTLPILNSLQRSLTPSSLHSPGQDHGVLDDRAVQRFFRANDSPDFALGHRKNESYHSEIENLPPVHQTPYPAIQTKSIEPLETLVPRSRKNRLSPKPNSQFKETDPLHGEKWLPAFTLLPKKTWDDSNGQEKCKRVWKGILQGSSLLLIIFLLLVTYELLSISLTLIMGKAYMNVLTHRHVCGNPMGLMMFGIITGVFTESFIYPTAIVAKVTETDKLPLHKSIYIVYGLHIGCTAASFFITLIFFSNKHKLRRGTRVAALYYVINLMTVIILLPFEVIIGMVANLTELVLLNLKTWSPKNCQVLRRLVLAITDLIVQIDFQNGASFKNDSRWMRHCSPNTNNSTKHCVYLFQHPSVILSDGVIGLILLVFVVLLYSLCLFALVKLTNIIFRRSFANCCQEVINKKWPRTFPWLGEFTVCLLTACITIIIQNHSLIIVICTLLAARGILGISRMFSILIGCNLGNSLSLILISLSDQSQTFFHLSLMCLVYNILGFFAWFITPCIGRLMINAAAQMGDNIAQYRWLLPVLITIIFILVPVILTSLSAAGLGIFLIVTVPLSMIFIYVVIVNAVLQYNPKLIPKRLRIWRFLPEFCHSLEPYDEIFTKYSNKQKLKRQKKRNERIREQHQRGDPLELWERSRVYFYKSDEPQNRSGSIVTRTGTLSSIYV